MKRLLIIILVVTLSILALQFPLLSRFENVDAEEAPEISYEFEVTHETEPVTLDPVIIPEYLTEETTYSQVETTLTTPEAIVDNQNSDAILLAKLLYGECRGVESKQQKAAVIWCVLNRVDSADDYYPNTIKGVVTQKNHFTGYRKSNPVWQELLDIAEDVLERWEMEKQGNTDVGRVLPKDYLWFNGNGSVNTFRNSYDVREGDIWDWSLPNPYES